MNESNFREKLATCSRILAMQELLGLFGHISIFDPNSGRMYMSPSMGVDKATIRPDDILVADLQGAVLEGDKRLPVEWPIHTVIHGRRKDGLAVAHLHAPYSTLFSISKRPFRPVTLQGSVFDAGLGVYQTPRLVTTHEDAVALCDALGDRRAALMRGHGVVVVGCDVEQMLYSALILEDEARKCVQAAALGDFHCLSHEDCESFGGCEALPGRAKRAWSYYRQLESRWDRNPGTGRTSFA